MKLVGTRPRNDFYVIYITMSLRIEQPEDSTIRWNGEVSLDMTDDMNSITSEDETGSEYDGEQRSRGKAVLEIWDDDYIWTRLQASVCGLWDFRLKIYCRRYLKLKK